MSVRNLDSKVYKRLRLRAVKHGVSMEEEVRRIYIKLWLLAPEKFSDVFKKYFGIKNGVNLDLLNQRDPHNPMVFNE